MRALSSVVAALIAGGVTLPAQQEAARAFRSGTEAFAAQRFDEARALFERAAETDADNPEVHLWLGRSRYELGDLDGALAAWRRTLELAPDEPLATRMVAALTGAVVDAAQHLALAEGLLQDGLLDAAWAECRRIRERVVLDEAQRAAAMLLGARIDIARGDGDGAQRALRELLVADPAAADRADVQLALGRAELARGGDAETRGLARLRALAARDAGNPAGDRADLELRIVALRDRNDATTRAALQGWIDGHAADPGAVDARRALVDASLEADVERAIPLAGELWPSIGPAERDALAERLRTRAMESIASDPARSVEALEALRALGLRRGAEVGVVAALAVAHEALALGRVQAALRGRVGLDGEPLRAVESARVNLARLRELDRRGRAEDERLRLARRLRQLASEHPDARRDAGGLHPCDRLAAELAIEVVRDAPARDDAVELAVEVADAAVGSGLAGLRGANTVLAELAGALDGASAFAAWSRVQPRRLEVLDELARAELARALRSGAGEAPAEPLETQRTLLAVAAELVTRAPSNLAAVLALVGRDAAAFAEQGRVELAAGLFDALAAGVPERDRPAVLAAGADVRLTWLVAARARRAAAGLPVAASLEPGIADALARLYALEARCTSDQLAEVRRIRGRVVDHYRSLGQLDVAAQAVAVRAAERVDRADAWAELRLADLHAERAYGELDLRVARGEAPAITPAVRAALDAYLGFVASRPTDASAPRAVDATIALAARLEQGGSPADAIVVYGELAATLGALTAPAELRRERAAQAAFAVAAASDASARTQLARRAGPALDEPTAAAVTAALDAYRRFAAAHADSPRVADVLRRALDLGVAVARTGAWADAERVFARLLEDGVRQVDQVAFCRAMCVLGPAFGDHALAMLAGVTAPIPATAARESAGVASGPATDRFALGGGGRRPARTPPAPEATGAFAADADTLVADAERLRQTVRQLERQRAQQIAALRDSVTAATQAPAAGARDDALTAAEVERIRRVFDAAYDALTALRRDHPDGVYAESARATILAMVDRWRALSRWSDAAALATRFLADAAADRERAALQLGVARDLATFASELPDAPAAAHATLREIGERFDRARAAFDVLVTAGGDDDATRLAPWERAGTWLTQARTVARLRAGLARGRFVRAARELAEVATAHPSDPEAAAVPDRLWEIGDELVGRGFHDEAVEVRRELWARHPMHPRADQAAQSIAQLYAGPLGQPLRAAELYQELNFARGGDDAGLQGAILAIGLELHASRRWIEALHVLESFVDSFPRHPRAGEALTHIGGVHQSNGAFEDAIAAYRRVIDGYPSVEQVSAARWAIAECQVQRSEWRRAIDGYVAFVRDYPKDGRAAEASRRVDVLKGLERYQQVVDEPGQRKAFDAQFQIAVLVRQELGLPEKAILEFAKVPATWPDSHLADDALYEVGKTRLDLGATVDARVALRALAERYPESPLADDALYLVGRSFEDEADRLASVTRSDSERIAQEQAQRVAYGRAQDNVRRFRDEGAKVVAELRKEGKLAEAEDAEAGLLAQSGVFRAANTRVFAQWASSEAEALTAAQLADREDRARAALRRAVAAYDGAAQVAGGDKAGEALLRMAKIHDTRLEDADAAMATWLEIVRQFSGTAVAEDASWRIAQFHDRRQDHRAAIEAYQGFLRNYRRSPNAGAAQAAIAENHEQLGEWVQAMDAYTNYINNFPDGPLVARAREQIAWIKTYRL